MPEGTPFCAACGAPQIRVVSPQVTTAPSLPTETSAPPPLPGQLPYTATGAPRVVWSVAFKKCLIAGVVTTLLLTFAGHPVLVFLLLPVGGWFGVFLYNRGQRGLPVNGGLGARIGAVTGLIGYAINIAVLAARLILQRTQVLEEMKRAFQEAASQNTDPQAQQIMQKLMSPEGLAVLVTIGAVFLFFMFLVLCSAGGALGGSLLKGRNATSA